tara:strand:- start:309 stop:893 length:585 start_codon:yes stop_codon:yes gene_type:complete
MAEYKDRGGIDDSDETVKRRTLLWSATQPGRRGDIKNLNATGQWDGICSKCGEVISKGQKIVTYHSPYWKELHHRNLCFDGSENDIILTSEDIPNHEDHVNRFVTALEVVKEDWSTELLAEIAGQDITMGKPSVELRALRIMNDRRDTTANPALVDILLTQLEQGAIRDRVKLEASNLLLMEKLKTHKEENEEE